MQKSSLFIILTLLLISCKSRTKSPFTNSVFTEVWGHYDSPADSLKRKALLFLVQNMDNKQGLDLKVDEQVKEVYEQMYKASKTDSFDLTKSYVEESYPSTALTDTSIITSDQLIENIDYAFKTREFPWAKQMSFNDFCEYVLPYRIMEEPLSDWRKYLYEQQQSLVDSLIGAKVNNPKIVCKVLSDKLFQKYVFSDKFNVPITNVIDLYHNPIGNCIPRYVLFTALARSIGLPVAMDYTPQYSGYPGNHHWISLLTNDPKERAYPFNGGEVWTYFPFHGLKMLRHTYSNAKVDKNDAGIVGNPNIRDVTSEYLHKFKDLHIPYKGFLTKPVYAFTFGSNTDFVLLGKGVIEPDNILIKDISTHESSFMLLGYYDHDSLVIVGNSFEVNNWKDELTFNKSLKPTYNPIRLYRKYPMSNEEKPFFEQLKGAKIQGSNDANFAVTEDIDTLEKSPEYYTEYNFKSPKIFKYYRFLPANNTEINLAELHFFIGKENTENRQFIFSNGVSESEISKMTDNNIQTNCIAPKNNWIGINASKDPPKKLESIKILPRNSFNIIEKGNEYELLYFDKGWKSLGRKTAQDYYLDYGKVPKDAVFLLKNLTQGKQERLFIYVYGYGQIFR